MSVAVQRPLRGSRISTFYPVKTLPSISSLDSAFQLQEYISLLIRADPHDVERIVTVPGKTANREKEDNPGEEDAKSEDKEGKGEITVDEACWIYEQLRRLAQDLTHPLITMLQQECTRASCPEMKAGEWLYLCVAHGNDGAMEQCCAIDYILHTLDSATALLNSPRAFPSRLSIPQTSTRHFSALARRLGRIFAHAYFHHREAFEQAEAESSLYARFLVLTKKFDLVPAEFLVIPAAEEADREVEPPRLLGASLEPQHDRLTRAEQKDVESDANRALSPPGPAGNGRNESPRKMGRSRTDTMVFSEAVNVAEELARGEGDGDAERHGGLRAPGTIVGSTSPFALQPVSDAQPTPMPESSATDPIIVPEEDSETLSGEVELAPQPAEDAAKVEEASGSDGFVMLAPPAEVCEPWPEENDGAPASSESEADLEAVEQLEANIDASEQGEEVIEEENVPVTEADITESMTADDELVEAPLSSDVLVHEDASKDTSTAEALEAPTDTTGDEVAKIATETETSDS